MYFGGSFAWFRVLRQGGGIDVDVVVVASPHTRTPKVSEYYQFYPQPTHKQHPSPPPSLDPPPPSNGCVLPIPIQPKHV